MHITTAKIFADHYQFYIFDAEFDHYNEPRLDWHQPDRLKYGYLATERAIYVSTVADLNTHRLRVFLNESPTQQYEREFSANLQIQGNAIKISAPTNSPEDDLIIPVSPGHYLITVCSNHVGSDELTVFPNNIEPLSDAEFLSREDMESYDIFIEQSPNQR